MKRYMFLVVSIKSCRYYILFIDFRNQLENLYYIPQDEDEKEFICATEDTSGMHKCTNLPHFIENGRDCTALLEDNITGTECIDWNHYYTDCQPGESNPFDGAISFDNIGLAWVAIFLVSTKHFMKIKRNLLPRNKEAFE